MPVSTCRPCARAAPAVPRVLAACCVAAVVCLDAAATTADPRTPRLGADYTMRYTALSAGPLSGHVGTARVTAGVRVAAGLHVIAGVPLALARVPDTPCCDPGLGNLAVGAAYASALGDALEIRAVAAAGLATASDSGLAAATMQLAASAHVVDDPEPYLPGTWSARIGGEIRRLHPHGWASVRARLVHRREPMSTTATGLRVTGAAGYRLPRGLTVSAAVTTSAAVAGSRDVDERFLHAVGLGGGYLTPDLAFGCRVWIPLDASVRASRAAAIELHVSTAL